LESSIITVNNVGLLLNPMVVTISNY
jgi:hypothetical protein